MRAWLPKLSRWQRIALAIAGLALAAGLSTIVFKAETANKNYAQTASDARARGLEPIEFNFDYSRKLRISKPRGAYVQAQRTSNGALVARFVVRPLRIEPQPGLASGYLPIAALELEKQAARTYPQFRLQFEGAARVNEAEGYQFAFNAQLREPGKTRRQLLGREMIVPEPYDKSDPSRPYPPGQAPKGGVVISMFATTLDQVPTARQVGDTGALKKSLRSFRFGS